MNTKRVMGFKNLKRCKDCGGKCCKNFPGAFLQGIANEKDMAFLLEVQRKIIMRKQTGNEGRNQKLLRIERVYRELRSESFCDQYAIGQIRLLFKEERRVRDENRFEVI